MDALKNWLLIAAVLVVAFLAFELQSKARIIESLQARNSAETSADPSSGPPPDLVQTSAPSAGAPAAAAEASTLPAVTEELGRYKEGLEKCVATLNTTAAAERRFEVGAFFLPAAPRAPQPADIVQLSDPWILPAGDHVVVSGKIYNRGAIPGEATIVVNLLRNGQRYDAGRQRLKASAGQTVAWEQSFRWVGGDAAWSVDVRIEP